MGKQLDSNTTNKDIEGEGQELQEMLTPSPKQ